MKKLIVAMALTAAANAFASFSYQGALRNADGSAVTDRNKTIVFRLYESPDANATPLWAGQQAVTISPSNGLFNVEIGDSTPKFDPSAARTPIDEILARSGDLYIGLEIYDQASGLSGEIRPRQRILPVPTASFAKNVKRAQNDLSVGGNLQVDGAAVVTSNVTFKSNVTVEGNLKLHNNATLDGNFTVNGTLKAMAGGKESEVIPVPVGGIIMWTQSTLPDSTHWAVCDGNGGNKINGLVIPDLRGRFVVGVNNGNGRNSALSVYNCGDIQGEEKHALTTKEMPSHYHLHFGDDHLDYKATVDHRQPGYDADSDDSGNSGWFKTTSAGGDPTNGNATAPHENRPPYYALYYIMRVR